MTSQNVVFLLRILNLFPKTRPKQNDNKNNLKLNVFKTTEEQCTEKINDKSSTFEIYVDFNK